MTNNEYEAVLELAGLVHAAGAAGLGAAREEQSIRLLHATQDRASALLGHVGGYGPPAVPYQRLG